MTIRDRTATLLALVILVSLLPAGPVAGARPRSAGRPAAADLVPTTVSARLSPRTSSFTETDRRAIAEVSPLPDAGAVVFRAFADGERVWTSDRVPVDPDTGIARTDTPDWHPGEYELEATFVGSAYFALSDSARSTFRITALTTDARLRVVDAHVASGEPLVLFARETTGARGPAVLLLDGEPISDAHIGGGTEHQIDELRLPDGAWTLRLRYLGLPNAGFGPSVSDPIEVTVGSLRGPDDGILIDWGRPTTGGRDVVVGIGQASGDRTVTQVRLSPTADVDGDGLLSDGTDFPASSSIEWTLAAGDDGVRRVHAQVRYADDSWSAVVDDDIALDRQAPTGTAVINDDAASLGDAWPNSGVDMPRIRSRVDDDGFAHGAGLSVLAVSDDQRSWAYTPLSPAMDATEFTRWVDLLTKREDKPGDITAYVKWRDAAGNWSDVVSDTIVFMYRRPVAELLFDGRTTPDRGFVGEAQVRLRIHTLVIPPEGIREIAIGGSCSGPKRRFDWRQDLTIDWSFIDPDHNMETGDGFKRVCVKLETNTGRDRTILQYLFLDRVVPLADVPVPAFALDGIVESGLVAATDASTDAVVSWRGSDNHKVAGYRAQRSVDAGDWRAVALSKQLATSVRQGIATGDAYRFRVRAQDVAGNAGSWRTGSAFRMEVVPDESPRITYRGTWSTKARSDALGGRLRQTTDIGASASITFTGRAIAWIAPRSANGDTVPVLIDGKPLKTVTLWVSAGYHPRRIALSVAWARSGTHTLKLVHRYAGHALPVDGFLVLR